MHHILGIRHHGPGSAQNVAAYLKKLKPDLILVEGPPEGDALLHWVKDKQMKPPVALLAYRSEQPQDALFYPFAVFSPEWQAIRYGLENDILVRFFDLPLSHLFALEQKEGNETPQESQNSSGAKGETNGEMTESESLVLTPSFDPIQYLAEAAGFSDGELWWEQQFETRLNNEMVFEAVMEAMQTLRSEIDYLHNKKEQLREATMRQNIRQAEKEKFQQVAVICGAWHAPALIDLSSAKEDENLLKKLPKVKVDSTWIPWTYNRLSYFSGYGAGILSPGWYQHLWKYPKDTGTRWLTKVARLFREKNMDVSSAHVIEAVRLAENLAALRGYARPGLAEMNEAVVSVICMGESIQLKIVEKELIVSDTIGKVPGDTPKIPLQADLELQQKTLRLKPEAEGKELELDLRQETDLKRSIFLNRLALLGIDWGKPRGSYGKGTFKENWWLQWEPELSVKTVEMGIWGNTVQTAASNFAIDLCQKSTELQEMSYLLEKCMPAVLPEAVDAVIRKIDALAAGTGDVLQLLGSLPPLIRLNRYGDVRKTDLTLLHKVTSALLTRAAVSLPSSCSALDETAAGQLAEEIKNVNQAMGLVEEQEKKNTWLDALKKITEIPHTNALIAGLCCRSLHDARYVEEIFTERHFSQSLSVANEPMYSALWLEGFLSGSGMILLLDDKLWSLLSGWVAGLNEETFIKVLPLLRRTFSSYAPAERRQIGNKAKSGNAGLQAVKNTVSFNENFDEDKARNALKVIELILGLKPA